MLKLTKLARSDRPLENKPLMHLFVFMALFVFAFPWFEEKSHKNRQK